MDNNTFEKQIKLLLNIPETERIQRTDLESRLTGLCFETDLEEENDIELAKKLLEYNVGLYIHKVKFKSLEDILNLELLKHITRGEIVLENCSVGSKDVSKIGLYKDDNGQTIIDIYDDKDLQFVVETMENRDNLNFKLNMTAITSPWEKHARSNIVSYEELVNVYRIYNHFKSHFGNSNLTDLDKILIAGMFLSYNTEYDFEEDESKFLSQRSIYGCLINGLSVCVGYSSGYMLLLKAMGFECRLVDSGPHVWNQVKIENNWYNIDITNLKSLFLFGNLQHEKFALTSNKTYFNHWKECGDEEITESAADKRSLMMCSEDFDRKTLYNHLNLIRSIFRKHFQTFNTDKFIEKGTELDDDLKQELDCH